MRTFVLIRAVDETGISGVGTVAEGVEWSDGTVSMRWLTNITSTGMYDSVEDVEKIHGHQGLTQIEFTSGGVARP
jgi:hypothetical protein